MVEVAWNRNPVPDTRPSKIVSVPPPMPTQTQMGAARFEACASTASLFLYAQGSTVLCLHHDTLALERRFENHKEDILFICVDNVSERGAGRLVVSYDASKTAIIWDLFTGSVIARFASFEQLKAASWMRNGNVAFGNEKGDVILFEPSTSDNVSCRTIFDPITALAPASDCRTYAIGYQNGSILIATLLPTFTILHTMTTSRGPSPIVSLAWHASSSKQKSDMLATMSGNGDLRVWSVAKPPGKDVPRVIRVLKRSDTSSPSEPKWMGWSKNGKIIQYLDGETWAWDVKTKHITYEPIPTIDCPLGIANYGPTAALFTLGPQYTVQQYDLESPAMVANVQHPPTNSMTAALDQMRARTKSPRTLQDAPEMRESGSSYSSRRRAPFDASGIEAVKQQRAELSSPESSRGRAASVSSKASSDRYKPPYSPPSRSAHTATSFSLTSAGGGRETPQPSFAYASSVSMSSVKSSRPGSRLRNEVQFSPADKNVDLFPFTRARLNDVPYRTQQPLDEARLTPDDLRRQMLSMVFGWDGDIEALIKDELYRHPPGSAAAILLAQWIDESDTDHMVSMISAGPTSIADWMLLALSQMNGQSQANKVGQAFAQKLLELGDVHTAATVLIGLGDRDEAVEVYVSQNYYMEAILMTCLVMPTDWQRQSYLVRRWGEHVVAHSQQQLAIRCFMCTGVEPSDPWASPAVHQAHYNEMIPGRSPMGSPEPAYPNPASLLQPHSAAGNGQSLKAPSLKLITSFNEHSNQRYRFPGLKSDDRTPTNAPGITPIAESAAGSSAMSPGGFGSYKLNNIQSLNNAMNSRSGTPGFPKQRLPSIGETPVDVHPPTFLFKENKKLVDYGSTSENDDTSQSQPRESEDDLGLLPSARYDPEEGFKPSPQTAVQATADQFATIKGLPSPTPGIFEALRERSDSRLSTRDRKPDGLHLSFLPGESSHDEVQSGSLAASFRSPPSTANSFSTTKSPSVSGRSIDQYINSLDEASFHSRKTSGHRRGRRNTEDSTTLSARKTKSRAASNDTTRGRNEKRYVQPAKRSPSSPVSMSPEELAQYAAKQTSKARSTSRVRKPRSRNSSERRRNRSSSRHAANRIDTMDQSNRGRSSDRQGLRNVSPPSPVPMTNPEDALKFVSGDRERRTRQRSRSRRPSASRREPSADGRRTRPSSRTRQESDSRMTGDEISIVVNESTITQKPQVAESKPDAAVNVIPASILSPDAMAEMRRKELAAAELEARRLSLARNPSAPNIPFPGEIQYTRGVLESPPFSVQSFTPRTPGRTMLPPKASPDYPSSSESNSSRSGGPVGLPATPRAMRHPKYSGASESEPMPPPPPPPPSAPPQIDTAPLLLSDARYQGEAERIPRSMSVPVPEVQPPARHVDMPMHPHFNPTIPRSRSSDRKGSLHHRRQSSRELSTAGVNYDYGSSPVTVSIEETMEKVLPPILPELQHLNNNTPPPPPPIPASIASLSGAGSQRESSGTIDIVIDNENLGRLLPRAMTAGPALSSNTATTEVGSQIGRRMSLEHRRNRSVNESFSSKIRNLTRRSSRGSDAWGSPTASGPSSGYGNGYGYENRVSHDGIPVPDADGRI
ncbi:uncharacterized protein DSM5745_10438 [Aspergillus mulundensis]|uniref:Gem-associated protein 5 TPR domain-containing protein n=1 Tax=Aspergillus mulundensis TaxID=1810919 RepID=A0A3D8QIW7_9EURO|nr:hypothetical protein DSM5745_10438 [Aspergillus mulundensis]RDW61766.1 hypothetical protein DSM5745_10438 [Aspergillus mulundensis]